MHFDNTQNDTDVLFRRHLMGSAVFTFSSHLILSSLSFSHEVFYCDRENNVGWRSLQSEKVVVEFVSRLKPSADFNPCLSVS